LLLLLMYSFKLLIMFNCNHSDILKRILSIFHDTVNFTEIELTSICEYLFNDRTIQFVLNNPEVFETIEYLEDIIDDNKFVVVEELEQHFKRKETGMRVFIENVMEQLNNEEQVLLPVRNSMLIHLEGGLYSIDSSSAQDVISSLLDHFQRINERSADKMYPTNRSIKQAVAHFTQWAEQIVIIHSLKIYFFYFREYFFLQFEFADCMYPVSPFEWLRTYPENRKEISLGEWYNLTAGLDVVVLNAFHRISMMESYYQLMVNNEKWQPKSHGGKLNRKEKISKNPKTPLEENISAIIQCAIQEYHANQSLNEEVDINKYVRVEERIFSTPLISINR